MREKNFIFAAYLPLFWAVSRQKIRKAKGFWGWIGHLFKNFSEKTIV
jgi:hypothetical protein